MGAAFGAHTLGTGHPVSGGVRRCEPKKGKSIRHYPVACRWCTPVRIA
jgi:hypothetical protein